MKDGKKGGDILFDIRHLSHTFETEEGKKFDALSDVTASIRKGSFTAIIGTNGSGKSTLARHLNALLIPTDGEIYVEGMKTSDFSHIWDIRQKVGMVFQSFNLFNNMTALNNCITGQVSVLKRSREEAEALIDAIPGIEPAVCNDSRFNHVDAFYKELFKQHSCEALVAIVKGLHGKLAERKTKSSRAETTMKRAKDILHGELSTALGIELSEVEDYIEQRIESN